MHLAPKKALGALLDDAFPLLDEYAAAATEARIASLEESGSGGGHHNALCGSLAYLLQCIYRNVPKAVWPRLVHLIEEVAIVGVAVR